MLKLQIRDSHQAPVWVLEKHYTIGSASDNHLVLDAPDVAPHHANLMTTLKGIFLKDQRSPSGSFVNGQRISQKQILPGDLIRLGGVELEVLSPGKDEQAPQPEKLLGNWRLVADGSWLAGQSYELPAEGAAIIGRSNECDIVIPGSHLSRRHTELRVLGGSLQVKDLDSVSGTYINEQPVTTTLAHDGDRLRLDVYSFRILDPDSGSVERRSQRPKSRLSPPLVEPRKVQPSTPKRWKTRPTSPGNRQEPSPPKRTQELWLWLTLLLAAGLLIAGLYWI